MTSITKKEIILFVKNALHSKNKIKMEKAILYYNKWKQSQRNYFYDLPDDIINLINKIAKKRPTTIVLTKAEYEQHEQNFKYKCGTLMFGDDFYDTTQYVDCKKVRKQFGLKGKIKIIITTESNPHFKNIANTDIHYKDPVAAGSK
jgi:hypothetical protein